MEDFKPKEVEEKVGWNFAGDLLQQISSLLARANLLYIGGDLLTAFRCLKAAKMRMEQTLLKDQRTQFTDLEKKAMPFIASYSSSRGSFNRVEYVKEAHEYYEKYNQLLFDALEQKGFLVAKKKDGSVMKF